MALKADLCSVMPTKMLPVKGLGFNHSGSRILSNLSFGKNAPTSPLCLSLRNIEKQQYSSDYNHKVLSMSARRATKLNAAVTTLDSGETRVVPSKVDKTYQTRVVSVETLVGPKGEVGEVCHIMLDHDGLFFFKEGQYLEAHFGTDKSDFSIASCRDGDSFDGKTLSLCVRRASVELGSISNVLCNLKAGQSVEISGPLGGKMVFPEDNLEATHIMVATATGVAPFRSNLQRLFVNTNAGITFNGQAWLISGADNYNSLLYDNEFNQIQNDKFKYQTALDNSVDERISESGDEIFTLLEAGAYIYFAGSKSMMTGIQEAFEKIAQERGVDWADMLAKLKANGHWRSEVY